MTGKVANQESTRELALKVVTKEEEQKRTDPNESHEKSLIILGSKKVGKTTMIYRFLEKEETPKATLAMDYSYGRKAGKSLIKDVVHVWEIGNLTASLVSTAMSGSALSHSPHHATFLIVLDLGKPEQLWNTLENCLSILRTAMKMSYTDDLIEEMLEVKKKSSKESTNELFPVKLCIIGGKHDEFRDLLADDRELVGKLLRATAHVLGASLHYHSAKDTHLLRRTKELLSQYGFKGSTTKSNVTDYQKPLSIVAGSDTFEAIDLDFSTSVSLDRIKKIFVTRFPQNDEFQRGETNNHDEQTVNDDNFNEPIIDRLCQQREQEIDVLLRDMLEAPTTGIPIPEPY